MKLAKEQTRRSMKQSRNFQNTHINIDKCSIAGELRQWNEEKTIFSRIIGHPHAKINKPAHNHYALHKS